jgi:hypothetical protein
MFTIFLMAMSHVRFSGGMLGTSVTADVVRPHAAVVNVRSVGRPVIENGHVEISDTGDIYMDAYTQERLRTWRVSVLSLDVHTDHMYIVARLPFVGTRTVTLRRECESSSGP